MKEIFHLLKQGNKPSLLAAIVNLVLGIVKGVAFFFTGNVAMFAEMMHSLGRRSQSVFCIYWFCPFKESTYSKIPNWIWSRC